MKTTDLETYQYGDTVRLTCTFQDFDDNYIDPDFIKVVFYDSKYNLTNEFIVNPAISKVTTGVYFFDYITPKVDQRVYFEWYGEIKGNPAIKRGSFRTVFIT